MALSNSRSKATGKRFILGICLLLILVGFSSMNWNGLMFHERKPDDSKYGHHYGNASSLSESAGYTNKKTTSKTSDSLLHDAEIHEIHANIVEMQSLDTIHSSEPKIPPHGETRQIITHHPNASVADNEILKSSSSSLIRGGNINTTIYMQLPLPNITHLPPISFRGCCGIGHRLSRNIPTMVYAISHNRLLHANWQNDVNWSTIFNDTANIIQGPRAFEEYGQEYPTNWNESPLAGHQVAKEMGQATAYHRYGETSQALFEMPLAQSIVKSLSDNLSSLVLSFLDPMRAQYESSDIHLCAHIREGNNETGDWVRKKWRHIDLIPILNTTLQSMRNFAKKQENNDKDPKVSVFVASDTIKARSWFVENAPPNWHIVQPTKELSRPESGVWFGEDESTTNKVLSQEERDEAMAEAVADVFALGECDALFIPNYSSFSIVGIMLARAESRKVFFYWFGQYLEYPPTDDV